jgi:DNA-binding LacI/PurR family transcriptional regulator
MPEHNPRPDVVLATTTWYAYISGLHGRAWLDEMPLLYEQLRAYLSEEIRSGRLAPGDRVPSESMLSAQFNVSRITSKKALDTLEQEGLVVRIRGKGSFVADGTVNGQVDASVAQSTDPPYLKPNILPANTIGFIFPDMSDVFGVRMFNAVEERCAERGWQLMIKRTRGQRDAEVAAISSFVQSGVAGLVVFPVHGEYYNDELLRIVLNGFPVVLVDRYLKGIAVASVVTDNHEAARTLTTHLIDQGHTHIAFLSPPPDRTSSIEDRRRGFGAALRAHGLPSGPDTQLLTLSSTLPGGDLILERNDDRRRMHEFLDAHVDITAFVVCEYTLALILESVLAERQEVDRRRVVTCFDSPEDPLGTYRFTHIRQNERDIGQTAVDLLLSEISGERNPTRVDIPFSLIERQPASSGV